MCDQLAPLAILRKPVHDFLAFVCPGVKRKVTPLLAALNKSGPAWEQPDAKQKTTRFPTHVLTIIVSRFSRRCAASFTSGIRNTV